MLEMLRNYLIVKLLYSYSLCHLGIVWETEVFDNPPPSAFLNCFVFVSVAIDVLSFYVLVILAMRD